MKKKINFHSIILPLSSPKAFSMPNLVHFGLIIGVSAALSLISKVCECALIAPAIIQSEANKIKYVEEESDCKKNNHTCNLSRVLSQMSYYLQTPFKFSPEAGSHFLLLSGKDLSNIVK